MERDVIATLEKIVVEIEADINQLHKLQKKAKDYNDYLFYTERITGLQLAKSKIWKRLLRYKRGEE